MINNEKILTLIISKVFWLILAVVIIGGFIIVTAITHLDMQSSTSYEVPPVQTSPFTVRDNTIRMWNSDEQDYYYEYE